MMEKKMFGDLISQFAAADVKPLDADLVEKLELVNERLKELGEKLDIRVDENGNVDVGYEMEKLVRRQRCDSMKDINSQKEQMFREVLNFLR